MKELVFMESLDELWVDDCGLSHLTFHTGANKNKALPSDRWSLCAKDWRECWHCRQIVLQIPSPMTLQVAGGSS